jgi:hypothetical protein
MSSHGQLRKVLLLVALSVGCDRSIPVDPKAAISDARVKGGSTGIDHVLLISVDGLHALDLQNYVRTHKGSTLAQLTRQGQTFLNGSTSKPSDSWPGLLAIVTGGSPKSTGIVYEVSYDRSLSAPASTAPGSNCKTLGTVVDYSEFIDKNSGLIDGGGGIDPANLPLDPANGCTPVYPHTYLRVNTIFEVAKGAGFRTAWSDKSLGYEVVNGPSGKGVDDLFNPEISAPLPSGDAPNTNVNDIIQYDNIKVAAILNEIHGFDHTGTTKVGVPGIFGMNFQAVSVGQKTAGYVDAAGTPTPDLAKAFDYVDASLGRFVAALRERGLLEHTAIIISAKHGQAPIDPTQRKIISNKAVPSVVTGAGVNLAASTLDDVALLWLSDQTQTAAAATALQNNAGMLGIADILDGFSLAQQFNKDSRSPDIIVTVQPGVIYAKPTASKRSEHGGFGHDDTNVPILVVAPGYGGGEDLDGNELAQPVTTSQIAPTILELLGLNPNALQAVQQEGTQPLPLEQRGGGNSQSAATIAARH